MGERISETRELWREHGLVGEHFGKSTFIGENTFLASTLGRTLFWRAHFLRGEQHFFLTGEQQTPLWRKVYNFLPICFLFLAVLVFFTYFLPVAFSFFLPKSGKDQLTTG